MYNKKPKNRATTKPTAAPSKPNSGAPPKPKMKIGPQSICRAAPTTIKYPGFLTSPADLINCDPTIAIEKKGNPRNQTCIYSTASGKASPPAPNN